MSHLDALESESIFILREAYNRFDRLAMLWSLRATTFAGVADRKNLARRRRAVRFTCLIKGTAMRHPLRLLRRAPGGGPGQAATPGKT